MARARIAITGSTGQLGESMLRLWEGRWDVIPLGGQSLDLRSWAAVRDAIANSQPHIVIHAGAATDVDRCEREPELAFRINALGSRNVAQATAAVGAKLVAISTNYVFDGTSGSPYHEFDTTNPISAYGASKLAGEREALAVAGAIVVRTAWLYGRIGRNFAATMRRLMSERDSLTVVDDQFGNPTFTDDLAVAIEALMVDAPSGIYHAVNSGIASWFDWAVEIAQLTDAATDVQPIPGSEYPRAATPPTNGAMTSLVLPTLGIDLPDWRDALRRYINP